MFKTLASMIRFAPVKSLVAAGVAACLSVSGSAQAAAVNISTGMNVTGVIDNIWKVASTDVSLGSSDLSLLSNTGYPLPPWRDDDNFGAGATSRWLVPVGLQANAPTGHYQYYTEFTVAAGDTLDGRYLSDNQALSITLFDGTSTINLTPTNTAATSFRDWTTLDSYTFTTAGTYRLTFEIYNDTNASLNPTGFRFDSGAVPEPGSLVMGALSTLALGGVSWKRRAARKS